MWKHVKVTFPACLPHKLTFKQSGFLPVWQAESKQGLRANTSALIGVAACESDV